MSGTPDLVVAGGVQNMSAIPIAAALVGEQFGFATRSPAARAGRAYGDQEISQFRGADDRRQVGRY